MTSEVPRDGAMHKIKVDPRDTDHEAWKETGGRHGASLSCLTVHIPGVTRRRSVASLHKMIAQRPRDEGLPGELCGVEHVEDVGIWQVPHTGRDLLRRQVARLGAQYLRPVVLVQAWQHVGPCPGAVST